MKAQANCSEVELLIQDYLDGYLLTGEREILETHVQGCAACRSLLDEMRRLDVKMEGLPPVPVPGGLDRTILDALPAYPARTRIGLAPYVSYLAAAVLLFGFALFAGGRLQTNLPGDYRVVEIVFSAPEAGSVAVVGDFNAWDPGRNSMGRQGESGIWRVQLKLAPGVYQYGFVIDGRRWSDDPQAERFLADGFGGRNSVLVVEG